MSKPAASKASPDWEQVLSNLESRWHDWDEVRAVCAHAATVVFDRRCDLDDPATPNA